MASYGSAELLKLERVRISSNASPQNAVTSRHPGTRSPRSRPPEYEILLLGGSNPLPQGFSGSKRASDILLPVPFKFIEIHGNQWKSIEIHENENNTWKSKGIHEHLSKNHKVPWTSTEIHEIHNIYGIYLFLKQKMGYIPYSKHKNASHICPSKRNKLFK